MKPASRLAALALLATVLAGCARGYSVKVTNLTDQPVTARILERDDGEDRTKVSRYIGPQDHHTLQADAKFGRRVWLTVDFAGNSRGPEELPLTTGLTVVNVRRTDEGGRGRIELQEVP